MISTIAGKCPSCAKTVSVRFKAIDITESFGTRGIRGVAFLCGSCSTILNVEADPLALKSDIVNAVLDGIGKR